MGHGAIYGLLGDEQQEQQSKDAINYKKLLNSVVSALHKQLGKEDASRMIRDMAKLDNRRAESLADGFDLDEAELNQAKVEDVKSTDDMQEKEKELDAEMDELINALKEHFERQ